uniref:C2 domain-containing protein n=1 Tax=Chromera velia CCMP2878 TaxID=1169474 RepID=A0A0G4HSD4_9ALVE|eukprot:Cvel_8247.t1-p1 / transcript=Cvel_8247.t1 / gene=Cvel_8247 / organism=Chromera_velia_CCMP2878 / gene_product=Extended synaptotagmin-2, putative / transcript_product=Extended synaptotagmin-2, putative / location=Cvel_scaffold451:29133-37668(+) / protein_length=1235 / sequence_SO=supercontig / SO=protein_coding / is_pseudo=false
MSFGGWFCQETNPLACCAVRDKGGDGEDEKGKNIAMPPPSNRNGPMEPDVVVDLDGVHHSASWMNNIVKTMWPYIAEYATAIMKDSVEPSLQAAMPGPFKSIQFTHTQIGTNHLKVKRINFDTTRDSENSEMILLHFDLDWQANCDIQLKIQYVGGFGIKELCLSGRFTVLLSPLLSKSPIVGGVQAFFHNAPQVSMDFSGLANVADLPVITGIVRKVVDSSIAAICVLPNRIAFPMDESVDCKALRFPPPLGVLRLRLVGCEGLWSADWGLFTEDPSDPFCLVTLGDQQFKTKVIMDDNNPTWDQEVDLLVHDPEQQEVRMKVYDWDRLTSHDLLAFIDLRVADLFDTAAMATGSGGLTGAAEGAQAQVDTAEGVLVRLVSSCSKGGTSSISVRGRREDLGGRGHRVVCLDGRTGVVTAKRSFHTTSVGGKFSRTACRRRRGGGPVASCMDGFNTDDESQDPHYEEESNGWERMGQFLKDEVPPNSIVAVVVHGSGESSGGNTTNVLKDLGFSGTPLGKGSPLIFLGYKPFQSSGAPSGSRSSTSAGALPAWVCEKRADSRSTGATVTADFRIRLAGASKQQQSANTSPSSSPARPQVEEAGTSPVVRRHVAGDAESADPGAPASAAGPGTRLHRRQSSLILSEGTRKPWDPKATFKIPLQLPEGVKPGTRIPDLLLCVDWLQLTKDMDRSVPMTEQEEEAEKEEESTRTAREAARLAMASSSAAAAASVDAPPLMRREGDLDRPPSGDDDDFQSFVGDGDVEGGSREGEEAGVGAQPEKARSSLFQRLGQSISGFLSRPPPPDVATLPSEGGGGGGGRAAVKDPVHLSAATEETDATSNRRAAFKRTQSSVQRIQARKADTARATGNLARQLRGVVEKEEQIEAERGAEKLKKGGLMDAPAKQNEKQKAKDQKHSGGVGGILNSISRLASMKSADNSNAPSNQAALKKHRARRAAGGGLRTIDPLEGRHHRCLLWIAIERARGLRFTKKSRLRVIVQHVELPSEVLFAGGTGELRNLEETPLWSPPVVTEDSGGSGSEEIDKTVDKIRFLTDKGLSLREIADVLDLHENDVKAFKDGTHDSMVLQKSPHWGHAFCFLISDLDTEVFQLEIEDEEQKTVLGSFTIDPYECVHAPGLNIHRWFALTEPTAAEGERDSTGGNLSRGATGGILSGGAASSRPASASRSSMDHGHSQRNLEHSNAPAVLVESRLYGFVRAFSAADERTGPSPSCRVNR